MVSISGNLYAYDLEKRVTELDLSNGMRWLLVHRSGAPVFSGVVMVRAGSSEETRGKTGIAHMFEHIAFKGSSLLGTHNFERERPLLEEWLALGRKLAELPENEKNKSEREQVSKKMEELKSELAPYQFPEEIWEIIGRNGGADLNAVTSKDYTAYFASLPTNRLELWARVFSHMIADPAFRDFYTERDVVREERLMRVDNDPNGKMGEVLLTKAFTDGPYQWSSIGLAEDIPTLTDQDAQAFHKKYYVASNMVGVLVGDFDLEKTKKILDRSFGSLPRGERSPNPPPSGRKSALRERFSFDAEPAWLTAFHKPTLPAREEYVFDVISTLLCSGPSSRLQRALVLKRRAARDVECSGGVPGVRLPNLFVIWAEPIGEKNIKHVERLVDKEILRLQSESVSAQELSRVAHIVRSTFVMGIEEHLSLALELARFETMFGDWRLLARYPREIEKVTAEDIQRVARNFFTKENSVIVERVRGTP